MGQILGKYDHDPPSVRSRCIFAKIYKAKKHPDKRRGLRERERERERGHQTITTSSDQTQGLMLSFFKAILI